MAGEGFAAQLADRGGADEVPSYALLAVAFPRAEPSPEFVVALRQQLMTAPDVAADAYLDRSLLADRRVVYGVAAFGSLASAAVVVAILLRNRGINRAAA
jgi:hypothetical protein